MDFIIFSFEETWIPLTQDALYQDWLKFAQWSRRRGFFNFVNVFSLLRKYLPLEKGRALHLNKRKCPPPKDALRQVWLKLAQWFWRRFFNFVNVYFQYFIIISPCKKGGALHLNKLESPLPKNVLCQVWLKLAEWFWRRRWKCEKFKDRQTDRQTDGRTDGWTDRRRTTGGQKS